MEKLTPQQELFIKTYTTKGVAFGNATLSYSEAYNYDLPRDENDKIDINSKEYNACNSNGSRLMASDSIRLAIRQGMLDLLDDKEVDARLAEILHKGQESNSIQAIKIHNELKQRITKKLDITSGGRPMLDMTDDELRESLE